MPWDNWTRQMWAWPLASLEMWRRALEGDDEACRPPPPWMTPARRALELASLRLWDFSTGDAGTAVVIVSPFALHDAQIADLAPGHSIVAALRDHGCARLYLVEWKSATQATRRHGVDDLLAALNVALDDIGAPVDLVGLCQGGWLSLVYAGRFPAKVRRLVVVGAPVDVRAAPSALSEPVDRTSDAALITLVDSGGGAVRGAQMTHLWPREADEEARLAAALEIDPRDDAAQETLAAFRAWDRRVVDLPGPYFCEVFRQLYRENALATGGFQALGRTVDLRELDQPLLLLVGETDAIAPPPQALAVRALVSGPVETLSAPCGHLALFLGRRTLAQQWPRVAAWLTKEG
jgi:polyhydroxyalkanoate synthase subunit PhaC